MSGTKAVNGSLAATFVFQKQVDEDLSSVVVARCVKQIEPFFLLAGTKKGFAGGFQRLQAQAAEDLGRQVRLQQ